MDTTDIRPLFEKSEIILDAMKYLCFDKRSRDMGDTSQKQKFSSLNKTCKG